MRTPKRIVTAFLIIIIAAVFSGCVSKSVDELYALPQLSEGYLQLQEQIDELLNSGAEYSAPSSGNYRQAVQLIDLDGDGVNEAVAFFAVRNDEKPLKVYIFKNGESGYEKAAVIEGEGTGIESIGFADMNGDGTQEIAVGWTLTSDVKMLTVYSVEDYSPVSIVSTDYQKYIITTLSGKSSVLVLRLFQSELSGESELYTMAKDGEVVSTTARLSTGIEALLRVRNGVLLSGQQAVYIEETINGSGTITDILAFKNGALQNITRNEATGTSGETERYYGSYCRDIDGNGVLDVPNPVALRSQTDGVSYYVIEWYSYDIAGNRHLTTTTYHNFSDGWYLVLPEGSASTVSVRREDSVSGERTIIFSEVTDGKVGEDIFAVYTLSGENRRERSISGNRYVLKEEDSVIYCAEVLPGMAKARQSMNIEDIRTNFNIIYSEWITGDI